MSATDLRAALKSEGFRGDIAIDWGTRVAASTDNSIYQIVPDAVLRPRDSDDLDRMLAVLNRPEFRNLPITGRGGSTGTNGQGLNAGVIVDFRRYMNRVLAIDADAGWVEVEPGVVLDQLNAEIRARGHDLFFAPDTSTASRCTIGGMISTDACGQGSRVFGKTSDNVLALDVALADGQMLSLAPLDGPETEALAGNNTPGAAVLREAMAACDEGCDALKAHVPNMTRHFVGYDLIHARADGAMFDPVRLIVGSEGTLALVKKARLKLLPIRKHKRLVIIAYRDFPAALASARALIAHDPDAIETLDDKVHGLAHREGLLDRLPEAIRTPGADGQIPVSNYVEFGGDTQAALDRRVDRLIADLKTEPTVVAWHVAEDPAEIAEIWSIRKSGVGLLGSVEGRRRPVPFVEDCVVPPENLQAFAADFRALLDSEGLIYGMFGHVDAGCIHVRPALDMADANDRARMARISDRVFDLVRQHGGIFWGEHGKGVRGQYLPEVVGPDAYRAFARVKRAFDPDNRMNPGKLVNPEGDPSRLYRIDETPFRTPNPTDDADPFADAFRCNGNAQCQAYAAHITMCPSYKATGEARHSPKGRADLLRAWHELTKAGDPRAHAVAEEVEDALDGCLGCKACATACPIHVDIPELKSRFLAEYHRSRPRRPGDRLIAMLEDTAPMLARGGGFMNALSRIGEPAVARAAGLVDLPSLSTPSLRQRLRGFHPERKGGPPVYVIQDPFTTHYDAGAVEAVMRGLAALGYAPKLADLFQTGKALHVKGYRGRFEAVAKAAKQRLDSLPPEVPRIGTDPSAVLLFRQEYATIGLAPAQPVKLVQEFLADEIAAGRTLPKAPTPTTARIMLHCTERTALPQAGRQWQTVFDALGLTADTPPAGCCGMAGAFGHEARNKPVSVKLWEMGWRDLMRHEAGPVCATGYSCRSQAKRVDRLQLPHPMALVAELLSDTRIR